MRIVGADITGSLIINGNDVTTTIQSSNAWSGSSSTRLTSLESFSSSLDNVYATDEQLAAATASLISSTNTLSSSLTSTVTSLSSSLLSAITSLSSSMTSTVGALSSSYAISSASLSTRVTTNETDISALQSASGSLALRAKLIEDQYATTGSNTFTGTQNVTNTTAPTGFSETTAAIYTAGGLQVTKDVYFSSSLYIKGDLTVYGTQSISYITSSQLNISDNIISVNTATPAVRFGGIEVYDSGSTGLTGSLLWDSQNNRWIYSNPSGSSYDGGMLISGPRNSSGLGNEQGTLNNYVMKGQGGDHITSSQIIDNGTTVSIPGNLQVTGSIYAANLTGSLDGSNLIAASVANSKLANSTISGISLGSNLATLTIGTGLSGTSYNGSTGVTIANSGVTSITAGTGISVNAGTGGVTITNSITNTNQLTNGAGFITSAGTSADSNALNGLSSTQLFNNMGANHGTRSSFDASTPSYGFGFRYVQGSGNGPGTSGTQFYSWYIGLGNDYGATGAGSYGAMFAVDRNVSNPYLSVRYNENNSFGSWRKIYAGYADSAGSAGQLTGNAYTNGSDGWFRSSGATGWYNATYTGGIFMEDSTWVRVYNGKGFYVPNQILATSDITAYYSDERLKEKKGNITNAIDKVKSLEAFYYVNNELAKSHGYNEDKLQIGLSAQQVKAVMPEIVKRAPFDMAVNEDGSEYSKTGEEYLTIDYGKLTPLLIEAIKEQQKQIDDLKNTINELTR